MIEFRCRACNELAHSSARGAHFTCPSCGGRVEEAGAATGSQPSAASASEFERLIPPYGSMRMNASVHAADE